jgi:hypothetical protein
MKQCVKHFFSCNIYYGWYFVTRNIYFINVNCYYCFVQWTVCNLSVCRKVNRQYKHNLACTEHDHQLPYWRITRPLAFHRELQNIYWKCHNHRRPYRRITRPSTFHRKWLQCHNHRRPYRWITRPSTFHRKWLQCHNN